MALTNMESDIQIPSSTPLDLHLDHPTVEECIQIWSETADSWKDSLTIPKYIHEAEYLTTVPLAKDGGMTTWVLVEKDRLPNERTILCSCESFRKRCLTSDVNGNIMEGIVHGIASVFCPAELRGCSYGARHMKELAKVLHGWQSEYGKSIGSILYSDIGKEYYTRWGWPPNLTNGHFVLPAAKMEKPAATQPILESDLEHLCSRDEAMIYNAMAMPSTSRKRVVILPDMDHMLWHIRKEDFATNHIFGKTAQAKGAIAGVPGKQVWAIWVHRYYEHPNYPNEEKQGDQNVLYILRLVVEGDATANKPREPYFTIAMDGNKEEAAALEAVMQAAQAEAADWGLDQVQLWEPSPMVQSILEQSNLNPVYVERQSHSIASVLWFEEGGNVQDDHPILINNEHYAWC
ncbi:hypothetical protein CORC01_08723 [Colletotrichum orchidophilum]|uniref:LYC1 C-terminal domain-containing protein n=1 Tax=Colletotrichum orchidophilum TaxID=1209926 RepID=A0A1G4B3P1_9PEZI|nr:uncharacterized protein CORC01_08723 [Colletotrichum orchidophilum]OHE96030.1 hypothetical protein CORC01_08723 [Colletotrichum orchidophilum]